MRYIVFIFLFSYLSILSFAQTNKPNGVSMPVTPAYTYTYPANYVSGIKVNWMRTTSLRVPVTNAAVIDTLNPNNKGVVTTYLDGLGRAIQTVVQQKTGINSDFVATNHFDSFNRQLVTLLPYCTNISLNDFKRNVFTAQDSFYSNLYPDDDIPYSRAQIDDTSRNYYSKHMTPGASNAGSGVGSSSRQFLNKSAENVRMWDFHTFSLPTSVSAWDNNTLLVKETTNASGIKVRIYSDKEGKTILAKSQIDSPASSSHAGWQCTYYIYDSLGRLRCVIPPLAVVYLDGHSWTLSASTFNELCYSYDYEMEGKVISKKIPGRVRTNIIHDTLGRQVLIQDGNMASINQWLFIKYDVLDRPILTGRFFNSSAFSASDLRTQISTSSTNMFILFLQSPIIANNYDTTSLIPDAEILSISYFDNYNKIPSFYGFSTTAINSLPSGVNAVAATRSGETYTFSTGGYVRILNENAASTSWKSNTAYYDLNGRVIQMQGANANGGVDTISNKYDFCGLLLSSFSLQNNILAHGITAVPKVAVFKTYCYDFDCRLIGTNQKLAGDLYYKRLNTFTYDNLGRLKQKTIGSFESQDFNYRIWGALESVNKSYCEGVPGHFFGEVLSYDYGFTKNAASGLPSGLRWRLRGSEHIQRAYGYEYDKGGRLSKGDYSQSTTSSAAWTNTTENYTAENITYDYNGNLSSMRQWGTKAGYSAPFIMDKLAYRYANGGWSNLLQAVDDTITTVYGLGEFHELGSSMATDYSYDSNGNATIDVNKGIDSILYNFLNKPYKIVFSNGNRIYFTYDAHGTMLCKKIVPASAPLQTIDYMGGLEYHNNILALAAHDEGRARPLTVINSTGDSAIVFEYDFFVKYHQNNVRSVFTEQVDNNWFNTTTTVSASGITGSLVGYTPVVFNPGATYANLPVSVGQRIYTASCETSWAPIENSIFTNIDSTRDEKPGATGPLDVKSARLNSSEGRTIGPSMILRVMAGDSVGIRADAFLSSENVSNDNLLSTSSFVGSLITALGGGPGKVITESGLNLGVGKQSAVKDMLTAYLDGSQSSWMVDTTKPQAFINYILLDDNLLPVDNGNGFVQILDADAWHTLSTGTLPIMANGYMLIFPSNRSSMNVHFDNITVDHYKGVLTTENHYYPYGLTITTNAISTAPENNVLLNSRQLHHNEFSGGDGLDWNYYNARFYDPQIGRWHVSDPLAGLQANFTPYHYCFNNPIVFNDPSGLFPLRSPHYGYVATPYHLDLATYTNGFTQVSMLGYEGGYGYVYSGGSYGFGNHDGGYNNFWNSKDPFRERWLDGDMSKEAEHFSPSHGEWGHWSDFKFHFTNNNKRMGNNLEGVGIQTFWHKSKGIHGELFVRGLGPQYKPENDGVSQFMENWNYVIKGQGAGYRGNLPTGNLNSRFWRLALANIGDKVNSFKAGVGGMSAGQKLLLGAQFLLSTAMPGKSSFYSVAYEVELPLAQYEAGYSANRIFANRELLKAINSDADFAASMENLGIVVPENVAKSPADWRWHHAIDEGIMHIVPQNQHTKGSSFWDVMHPNGFGGMKSWGANKE